MQNNNKLNVTLGMITLSMSFMLNVNAECHYAECHYTKCHFAKCRYAECSYAKYCYAECRYAECHYTESHYAEFHYSECRCTVQDIPIRWEGSELSQ